MSLDVHLIAVREVSVYSDNMTHNLGEMAEQAGIYSVIWRPEESGVERAQELIIPLEMGLDRFYGKAPAGDDDYLFLVMESEFKGRRLELKTSNYGGITSNLSFEWDFVVNPDQIRDTLANIASFNSSGVDPVTKIEYPKRKTVPLEIFLRHPTAIRAQLTKAELVGLRLYTGPAYAVRTILKPDFWSVRSLCRRAPITDTCSVCQTTLRAQTDS